MLTVHIKLNMWEYVAFVHARTDMSGMTPWNNEVAKF